MFLFADISDDEPKKKVALIAGCVGGGVLLVCAIAAGIWFYSKGPGYGRNIVPTKFS